MPYFFRRGLGDTSPQVQAIAQAIAKAEGFFNAGPSSAPVRNNNPCDLTSGGALAVYPDLATGWSKCDNQVQAILGNTSSVYTSDMSISEIASHWAPAPSASCGAMCSGNDPTAWASNVAAALGVDPSTPLNQIGASGSPAAQNPIDSTLGLPDASTGIQLVDDSGNLTVWSWGGIAVGVGLLIWLELGG